MFGKPIHLFRLFGFPIRLDPSWFIVAVLITWTLASALFPAMYSGLGLVAYIGMGLAGALGLFASVVLHEMGHSLVARRFGLPIKGITLFIFGGVAELEDEPRTARDEFLVAVAGPIVSLLIAMVTLALARFGSAAGWPVPVVGVCSYLASVNLLVVLFNMVPAFPLDGGRVLRSALWKWRGDLQSATRITAGIGSGFGFVLIALGLVNIVLGGFLSGLWWLLIGLFLRGASASSYRHVLVRHVLEGKPVRQLMTTEPVTVAPDIAVQELVEAYIYVHHHKLFPVVEQGRVAGCVQVRDIKEVPREQWDEQTVRDVMTPCSPDNTITPDADAMEALSILQRSGHSRFMVVEGDQLRGIVSLKDLMHYFSLKMELEGDPPHQKQSTTTRTQRQQQQDKPSRAISGQGHLGYDSGDR
jgi:Zn-dependent protease